MRIAFTGASGLIGQRLREYFSDTVIIQREDSLETIQQKLIGVDTLINLAGAPILKRWSYSYKKILYTSRVSYTKRLVEAINHSDLKHFISTSAIGIYPNDQACDEQCHHYSNDFLGRLVQDWERVALTCQKPTTILRLGIVLDRKGGALKQMLLPFRLGLGGPIGDGSMMMSWITLHDLVRLYDFIISHHHLGIFNATTPTPVTNLEFSRTLADTLHRPAFLPLPKSVLTLLYHEAASVLTNSKEVYPRALEDLGFSFAYPKIDAALTMILKTKEK